MRKNTEDFVERSMFKVNGYSVSFRHIIFPTGLFRRKGMTVCKIFTDSLSVQVIGVSACSLHDNFDKSIGRKIALTEALEKFHKEDRRAIWSKYWETLGGIK